ncbi:FecR/PupR family sigma factor regulator [Providencia huaxiensis]|uniref:FecR/PupR family sigma factor regulator n=1 Tax=Providencia huaxiensis TaxID=2027290 RepID=UPI0034DCEB3B
MTHNSLQTSDDANRIDEEAALWFTRMHSQRISALETEQFKQWLAASSEHAKAYDAIAAVWREFDMLPALPVSNLQRKNAPFFAFGALWGIP